MKGEGYIMLGLLVLVVAIGCKEEAERQAHSSNARVNVEQLFEVDGCTVYRFNDYRDHYFARCANSASVSETHTEHCGKSCNRTVSEEVPTVYVEAQ